MEQRIQLVHREHQEEKGKWDNLFTVNEAEKTKRFHVSIPGYQPTVLENLSNLANELGLGALYVKDESSRFGLNAFKSLGGSYCIANVLKEKFDLDELTFSALREEIGLDENSRVLCISTEGATDRENYRKIVWDGLCSSANL